MGYVTIMLSTFVAQVILIILSLWLVWTEAASPMITSIQGRYFLPALICGVLAGAAFLLRRFVAKVAGKHPGR